MNDEHHPGEQWAAFQKIWGETFAKLLQAGVTFTPDSAPPEFLRQMRNGIFQALAQSWDQFLRSPQFLDGMKQWMEQALAFRKMSNEFFTKARREAQTVSHEDIDAVMLAVRHMETRVLDRTEELAAQVAELQRRLDGSGGGNAPASRPKREPPGRQVRNPRKK